MTRKSVYVLFTAAANFLVTSVAITPGWEMLEEERRDQVDASWLFALDLSMS